MCAGVTGYDWNNRRSLSCSAQSRARNDQERNSMNLESIISLIAATLLLFYLAAALLRPEKF